MKKYTIICAVLLSTILISAQSITNINPDTGMPLESLTVTISGENTHFYQATNTTIWFSQGSLTVEYPNSINILDDFEVEATITFGSNYETNVIYDVNLYNGIDGLISLPESFTLQTLPTPLIVSILPDESNILETLTVTISGENTNFNQATNTAVWFSQGSETIINSNTISVIDDTNFEAEFSFPSSSLPGYYDVNVFSEFDGNLILENGFNLGLSSIQSVQEINLIVSPNPSSDIFYIKSEEIIENINLYNVNGKLVNTFNVFSKETSLNTNNLSKGIYFLKIKLNGHTVNQSIIVD